METLYKGTDLIVFSHLRWDFVFQRPQHLMSRYAKVRKVYFIEEPVFGLVDTPMMNIRTSKERVEIVVPHFPENFPANAVHETMRELVDSLIEEEDIHEYALWYYTPMALPFSRHLHPECIIYDCMDELSLFKNAPAELLQLEAELFEKADVIFTGGHSLYEAKKDRHHNIHPMPSSIDFKHFSSAKNVTSEPLDQKDIPHPRLGFFGVIDERFDIDLLAQMAEERPDWHFVMIGPVVKIDPATLPQNNNIHYLGKKNYDELPVYLAGWDCALLPFAINDSTRFISPTKTPEYLAAGKPVVSSAIRDVVRPYGEQKLVHIAETAQEFIHRAQLAMEQVRNKEWQDKVQSFLSSTSWDHTWKRMADLELKIKKNIHYGDHPRVQEDVPLGVIL